MLAVDTNVVVRYLVADDVDQFRRAADILENNLVSISLTVLLEVEWVLRDAYDYARDDVIEALRKVLGLPTVTVQEERIVVAAMAYVAAGLEFADALHLAQAATCEAFVTFDRQLVRRAKRLIDARVRAA